MAILAPDKAPGISPEPITPMKVSEAMRLGAMTTEPTVRRLWEFTSKGTARYACAIGAAWIGSGHKPYEEPDDGEFYGDGPTPPDAYGWFGSQFKGFAVPLGCPVTLRGVQCDIMNSARMNNYITLTHHLNDDHELPREWIANFLESLGY